MRYKYSKFLNLRQIASDPKKILLVLLFIGLAIFANSFVLPKQSFEARVIKVVDGDTIEVVKNNKNYRVRFYGIDAPESKQKFGSNSRDFLASLILGKNVTLIQKDIDKYDRILAIVKLNDKDINQAMVENGYAWAYDYYTEIYLPYEKNARTKKLGLWKDKNPIEPYKWRKMNKFGD
ncbi:thermonuclease family protein [Campylobacter sp. US33a]|uniref:Thermonuclease family protein n=1 Tax=Campylobacter sp. CCS1377 TaxID=3158229 RepID=A0AAU7EAY8_9BACT|nr:thermonuclease family protein [Campylobacter sp. US33a]MCW1360100.1 thermonuclease family protein [Campylobacter jejuni]TEY02404.1 thermonuclease family protein [Campylobacter sp. US33a]